MITAIIAVLTALGEIALGLGAAVTIAETLNYLANSVINSVRESERKKFSNKIAEISSSISKMGSTAQAKSFILEQIQKAKLSSNNMEMSGRELRAIEDTLSEQIRKIQKAQTEGEKLQSDMSSASEYSNLGVGDFISNATSYMTGPEADARNKATRAIEKSNEWKNKYSAMINGSVENPKIVDAGEQRRLKATTANLIGGTKDV